MEEGKFEVLNELGEEVHQNAVDHGFHKPGRGELDTDATFIMNLYLEIGKHWEKLRRGQTTQFIDDRIFKSALEKMPSIARTREDTPLGRMARHLVNLAGEIAELWEAALNNTLDEQCDKECPLTNEEEEMADLQLRLVDTACERKVNLARAVRIKAEYNRGRPFMHGKKA